MAGPKRRRGVFCAGGALTLMFLLQAYGWLSVGECKAVLVGGDYHWRAPPENDTAFFQEWADSVSPLHVGDAIIFDYGAPYSVYLVDEADFKNCDSNHTSEVSPGGNISVLLNTPGLAYVIDGLFCTQGMLFSLLVAPLPSVDAGSFQPPKAQKIDISGRQYKSETVIGAIMGAFGAIFLCALSCFIHRTFYRNRGELPDLSDMYRMRESAPPPVTVKSEVDGATQTGHTVGLSASRSIREGLGIEGPSHLSLSFSMGGAKVFSLQEVKDATREFAKDFCIGEGQYGKVYRGRLYVKELHATREVAVKRPKFRKAWKDLDLINFELSVMGAVSSRNLVQLLGYCYEHEGAPPVLVYELVSRGSLSDHLFGYRLGSLASSIPDSSQGTKFLDWDRRLQIAIGTAKGLEYLHTSSHPALLIHKAVNTGNILLDDEFQAKVADFGHFGSIPGQQSSVRGSNGFVDPYIEGPFTDRSDIFSFGVVLMALVTSKRPYEQPWCTSDGNFVDPFFTFIKNHTVERILDPELTQREGNEGIEEMKTVAKIAASCMMRRTEHRPSAKDLVFSLEQIQIERQRRIRTDAKIDAG